MSKEEVCCIVEDNRELVQDLSHLAQENGWHVYTAECVQQGIEQINKISRQHTECRLLLILDLMLPETKETAERLAEVLAQRYKLAESYITTDFKEGISIQQVDEVRKELTKIDGEIRELINTEGGVVILEQAREQLERWEIVIFTARSQDAEEKAVRNILGDDRKVEWIQKPVAPERIDRLFAAT